MLELIEHKRKYYEVFHGRQPNLLILSPDYYDSLLTIIASEHVEPFSEVDVYVGGMKVVLIGEETIDCQGIMEVVRLDATQESYANPIHSWRN